jgi:hypothetical protein
MQILIFTKITFKYAMNIINIITLSFPNFKSTNITSHELSFQRKNIMYFVSNDKLINMNLDNQQIDIILNAAVYEFNYKYLVSS